MATGNPRKRPAPNTTASQLHASEVIRQYVVDKVTEKVNQKAEKHSDKINRLAPLARDALDLWTRAEPAARRPRFTRDEIAETAVRIADAEGIDALSMRRLAAELGAGTMTLYHYVRTKDELLTLVTDAVMAEVVLPADQLPDDWRAAVTAIAHSSRAALERHPWVFDIVDDPAIGPNGVRHFDQSLQAVESLPGTLADKLDVIFVVDEYVFGHALHARNNYTDRGEQPEDDAALLGYVQELTKSGEYPRLAALIAEHGLEPLWTMVSEHGRDETRFDRNLARLLDGIDRDLAR